MLNAFPIRGQWPEGWQTAGFAPVTTEGSSLHECLVMVEAAAERCRHFRGFEGWQTAGLNALNNRGQWPDGWQTAGLNALNNRGQWPECRVEAAAEGFRGFRRLRAGKRQA